MSRSLWKPLYNNKKNLSLEKNFILKIYNRHQKITSEFLNLTVRIYNGIKFFEIFITEKMLNHKFGEFSPTRKFPLHKKKKNMLKKKT
jgi:small subunit ribosomal protein S19